jgi:hypothetical protein
MPMIGTDEIMDCLVREAGRAALAERDRDAVNEGLERTSRRLYDLESVERIQEETIENLRRQVASFKDQADALAIEAAAIPMLKSELGNLDGMCRRLAEKDALAEKPLVELYESAQNLLNVLATEHGRKRAPRTADACDRLRRALHGAFDHVALIPF